MAIKNFSLDPDDNGPSRGMAGTDDAFNRQLLEFAQQENPKKMDWALGWGADPNFQDAEGLTALHRVASLGSRTCVRMLVATGRCNYLLQDNYGRYAADLAIEWARDFALGRWLRRKQIEQARRQGVRPWEPPKSRKSEDGN